MTFLTIKNTKSINYFAKNKGEYINRGIISNFKRMELTKVILTAMQSEAEMIIKKYDLKKIKKFKNITIYEGKRESEE
jgi:hypothetical protein